MNTFDFQVSLLNQERIIETIKNTIEEKLRNSNTTRIFQTQVTNWLFSTVYLQTCFYYLVPYKSVILSYLPLDCMCIVNIDIMWYFWVIACIPLC